VQEQLARTARLVAEAVRGLVFGNVGVDEKQLAGLCVGISLGDAGLPVRSTLTSLPWSTSPASSVSSIR